MAARTNATPATSTGRGILRPDELARYADVARYACAPELAPWVEKHWLLRWDLPPGMSYLSQTLPHPACTLSVERGHPRAGVGDDRVVLTGVVARRFDVELRDSGWVLGVKFRPGGLAALTGLDASGLTDRIEVARGRLPDAVVGALGGLHPSLPDTDAITTADRALLPLAGAAAPDDDYAIVIALVETMLTDRSLLRVDDLLARHDLPRRRVERLFARYIGVAPKWLLARYRMHDVVAALDEGPAGPDGPDASMADLAARFGWYDQAHFTRDFVGLVGVTPAAYARAASARASTTGARGVHSKPTAGLGTVDP